MNKPAENSTANDPSHQYRTASTPVPAERETLATLVDAHVHLWDPHRLDYSWLTTLPTLQRSFVPEDYEKAWSASPGADLVVVEGACDAAQNLDEVRWISDLASKHSRIRGMVAAVAIEHGEAIRPHIEELAGNPLVKGVRRILQGEQDPEFCLREEFLAGMELLAEFDFSFDICVGHAQLPAVIKLAKRCPRVRMILDHLGKPAIKDGSVEPWREHLQELSTSPNVWCKISGLLTEADLLEWRPEHLVPYVHHAVVCFGFERLVYGSDWPVSTLAAGYQRWPEIVRDGLGGATRRQVKAVFQNNARKFYRLSCE